MRILITGITGSIGSVLAPRLLAAGHDVSGLSRRAADSLAPGCVPAGVRLLRGDTNSGAGLATALAGIEVVYYLIHSMESTSEPTSFAARERLGAENFATAARQAGVRRVVFLGGMLPRGQAPSTHLGSRLLVEQTLLAAIPDSVALRASIVIGERSRSFRLLVRLVERMPVLPLPSWQRLHTAPVDQRDVIECLTRAATATDLPSHSLDLAGPDIVSYGELLALIRDQLLLPRPIVNLDRIAATPIAAVLAAAIAGEDPALVGPLMHSLGTDLLPREPDAATVFGYRLHSLHGAIAHALSRWETHEPLQAR